MNLGSISERVYDLINEILLSIKMSFALNLTILIQSRNNFEHATATKPCIDLCEKSWHNLISTFHMKVFQVFSDDNSSFNSPMAMIGEHRTITLLLFYVGRHIQRSHGRQNRQFTPISASSSVDALVIPSVCPSACMSHVFGNVSAIVSSWKFQE